MTATHSTAHSHAPGHTSVCTVPGVARLPPWTSGILTVPRVPITGRVIAGLVTVVVTDPIGRASLCTVGHRPGEVDLGGRGEMGETEGSGRGERGERKGRGRGE